MINNWEAVYKKLVIKAIMELAGKLDLGDEVPVPQVR